jgi:hypothetical protein
MAYEQLEDAGSDIAPLFSWLNPIWFYLPSGHKVILTNQHRLGTVAGKGSSKLPQTISERKNHLFDESDRHPIGRERQSPQAAFNDQHR